MGLRDVLLFVVVFGGIPFMLRSPYIGVLYWTWLGLMNPHRLVWGPALGFQFAQIVALATLIGLLFTKEDRRWKGAPEVYILMVLLLWMSVTTVFALDPASAFEQWKRVMKVQVMGFVALIALSSKRHIELMVWVLALSVGYFGLKGGIFTIQTGGEFKVWGPADSAIEDNNAMALATIMTIPLFYYLFATSKRWWLKAGFALGMVLLAFSTLGSQSRGALIAIGAMTGFLWLHSRNKVLLGASVLALGMLAIPFMSDRWEARMRTIVEYEAEGSAQARLHTWTMLYRIANDRITGAGFDPYNPTTVARYLPEWPTVHSAHSIYFQFLGEHGWVGLALFLLMWFCTWRTARWIRRTAREREDLKWAHSLSSMIQVSLIGYFAGGAFLNLGYWDFPYYLLILLVVLRHLVRRELAVAPQAAVGGQPVVPQPSSRTDPRPVTTRTATRSSLSTNPPKVQGSHASRPE